MWEIKIYGFIKHEPLLCEALHAEKKNISLFILMSSPTLSSKPSAS